MTISKQQFDSMASMQGQQSKQSIKIGRMCRAKVVNVKDPKKRGRIKVWIPDMMYGKVPETKGIWAKPMTSIFTGTNQSSDVGMDDCGSCAPPPKDSTVWVYFEDEDANNVYYFAGLNLDIDESVPVECQQGSEYYKKWVLLKSPAGRVIMISDDADDESVIIRGKYQNRSSRTIEGDPRKPQDSAYIEIWEKSGEEYVIMKDSKGQFFLLDTKNERVRIQHSSGSYIEMTKDGDIIIQAQRDIHLNSYSPYVEDHM